MEDDAAALRLKLLSSIRTSKSGPKSNILSEKEGRQESNLQTENKGNNYLIYHNLLTITVTDQVLFLFVIEYTV